MALRDYPNMITADSVAINNQAWSPVKKIILRAEQLGVVRADWLVIAAFVNNGLRPVMNLMANILYIDFGELFKNKCTKAIQGV